jgi:hypothetical protein
MKKILILILCVAPISAQSQNLRDAIAQLEQEVKLTSTQEDLNPESNFWPQCKIWAGICAIALVSQFVGYYMQDRRETARAQAEHNHVKQLEAMIRQLMAQQQRADHEQEPLLPFGTARPSASTDPRSGGDQKR